MPYYIVTVAALVVSALAAPTEESQCPQTVCVDAVNSCGVRYGDCYDACEPSLQPTSPECTDAVPVSSPSPISTENCSTRTVCADYINDCGVWYGGCFPDCTPWPTFTAPPCTSSSVSAVVITTTTTPSVPEETDCHTQTVCADYVNDCGIWYGGCFPDCTPWPTFTAPPCTSSSVSAGVITTTTPPIVTIPAPEETDCHTQTVCEDFINECGQTYGGCFSACTPWPTFTPPPCTTTTTTTTTPTSATETTTICRDYFKTCTENGTTAVLTYGGCYALGGPTPTFSEPPCPTATVTAKAYPTKAWY